MISTKLTTEISGVAQLSPSLLEDNVTFQVSETGNRHRESNVKIIIYAYESDDSSDIILNEMWNYKQHNQHTKKVSDSFLSWNSFILPDDAKDIVLYEKLTFNIGVIFFLQKIHLSSQIKLKIFIWIESEATNITCNM